MRITDDYVFFWDGIYSNWHPSKFEIYGEIFNCAEQAMMWSKANSFGDHAIAAQIMKTALPREQKRLGRKVKNFDPNAWDQVCIRIVTEICLAKFSQNEDLRETMLLQGDGRNFVEASPLDVVWGIGMAQDDYGVEDKMNWKGTNYLGICLDRVYKSLRYEFPK